MKDFLLLIVLFGSFIGLLGSAYIHADNRRCDELMATQTDRAAATAHRLGCDRR